LNLPKDWRIIELHSFDENIDENTKITSSKKEKYYFYDKFPHWRVKISDVKKDNLDEAIALVKILKYHLIMKNIENPESDDNKCVHTEHCCKEHGCKYREDNCPVVRGVKNQSYLCEECEFELNET